MSAQRWTRWGMLLGWLSLMLLTSQAAASTDWPNEPAGSTVMTDWPWTVRDGGGWESIYNGSTIQNATTASELQGSPAPPLSPPNVLEFNYPIGFTGMGGAPDTISWLSPIDLSEVYTGFWWMPSNPWQGHPSNGNKIAFHMFGNRGIYSGFVIPMLWGPPPTGPFTSEVYLPIGAGVYNCSLPNSIGDCPGSRQLFGNSLPVSLGQWHRIEKIGRAHV